MTEARVKEMLVEHLCLGNLPLENSDNLIDDLGANSLDIIEIVMAFEDEFGIEITDAQGDALETVQDVIDLLPRP